jgi:hypothetical protein
LRRGVGDAKADRAAEFRVTGQPCAVAEVLLQRNNNAIDTTGTGFAANGVWFL